MKIFENAFDSTRLTTPSVNEPEIQSAEDSNTSVVDLDQRTASEPDNREGVSHFNDDRTMDDYSALADWFPAPKEARNNHPACSKNWASEMVIEPRCHKPYARPFGGEADPYGFYAYIIHFCDDENWMFYRTIEGADPWERFNEVEHRDVDIYPVRIVDPDLPKLGIPVTYRETLEWFYDTCHIEPEHQAFWDSFFTDGVPWTLIPKTIEIDLSDKDFELCVGIDENRVGCRDSYHIIAFGESSSGCA